MILVFLLQLHLVNSTPVPLDNQSADSVDAIDLHQDSLSKTSCTGPPMRDISDILQTCLLTILACIWISIHPNIPRDSKWITAFLQRAMLAVYTLVLPEVVVFWGVKQWQAAGNYAGKYKDHGWTRTHGFFLLMGGFVICDGSPDQKTHRTVAPAEFDELVSRGDIFFPSVTQDELEDRSKGDALTKGILIIQNLWFIAQCAGRAHQGLIITELELVTLGFTALNGMIYYFWVKKPLDVKCPILLQRKLDKSVHAIEDKFSDLGDDEERSTSIKETLTSSSAPSSDNTRTTEHISNGDSSKNRRCITVMLSYPIALVLCILSFPTGIIFIVVILIIFQKAYFQPLVSMDESMLISSRLRSPEQTQNRGTLTMLTNTKMPMLYAPHESFIKKNTTSATCGLAGVLIGGIHCVAWYRVFPTPLEKVAWRMSAAWLAGLPLVYSWIMIVLATPRLSKKVLQVQPEVRVCRRGNGWIIEVKWNGSVSMFVLCVVMIIWDYGANMLYALSRLYTIVGALVMLRDLERGAAMDVVWGKYIPHI